MLVPSDEKCGKVAAEHAVTTFTGDELPVTRVCGRLLCEAGVWYLRHHELTDERRARMQAAIDAATACMVKDHYCYIPADALSLLHQAGSGYLQSLQVVGWRKTYLRTAVDESFQMIHQHEMGWPESTPAGRAGCLTPCLQAVGLLGLFLALVYAGPVVLAVLR
jgi:hypothetical protein